MPQSIVNALRRELEAASRDLDAWMQHPARDPDEDRMEGVAVIDAYHKARREWRDYARAHPRLQPTFAGGNLVTRTEPRNPRGVDSSTATEASTKDHDFPAQWIAIGGLDNRGRPDQYPRTPRLCDPPEGGSAA